MKKKKTASLKRTYIKKQYDMLYKSPYNEVGLKPGKATGRITKKK